MTGLWVVARAVWSSPRVDVGTSDKCVEGATSKNCVDGESSDGCVALGPKKVADGWEPDTFVN